MTPPAFDPATAPLDARPSVIIDDLRPEDDAEALALDRACLQGEAYRLSFQRSTFDRRAKNFERWRILAARSEDRLVGTLAVALKQVELSGRQETAAFLFDLRVNPGMRRQGIARGLGLTAIDWASGQADLMYIYAVADNRIVQHLASLLQGEDIGGYAYLVYPTYRPHRFTDAPRAASFAEVHQALLANSAGFDFYTNPECRPGKAGYVGSWLLKRGKEVAGCSAWSNRDILGEVVERLPRAVRIAGSCIRAWPLNRVRWPHIPEAGEVLRSWYLFDVFATNRSLARELMRGIEHIAVEREIDYCYVIHQPGDAYVRALQSDVPRLFSPVVRYRLLARCIDGPPLQINRIYVDIRDL